MGVVAKSTGDSMQLETEKTVLQGCFPVLVYLQLTRNEL